jgi:Tfp pilus assembly protein PilO
MNEKRTMITVIAAGCLIAAGAGALIYFEYENIDQSRQEVAQLRTSISTSRDLLKGTSELEREVIVLRETEQAIKEILPDEQDVNNFVRELRKFEEDSEVRITGLKKKPPEIAGREKKEFDKVAYQLTFEADAFQLLAFLDRIESHSRFMRVPNFKLSAASRRQVEETGVPAHKVQMDVETYVYGQPEGPEPVKVEGYTRKRELLLGEIIRRQQALRVDPFVYRGQRGRRDPWVDPRVPVTPEGEGTGLSVQEQNQIVDAMVESAREMLATHDKQRNAPNVIEQMTLRAELESQLSTLEEELRRVLDEGAITFVPAESRMQLEVVDPINSVRSDLAKGEGGHGPTADALRELLDTMGRHLNAGEHKLALDAFETVKNRLETARNDPVRGKLVEQIEAKARDAEILHDFEQQEIHIEGIAIQQGQPPIALINGKALGEGDLINNELVIGTIRPGEIEFIFRGVVLLRRF